MQCPNTDKPPHPQWSLGNKSLLSKWAWAAGLWITEYSGDKCSCQWEGDGEKELTTGDLPSTKTHMHTGKEQDGMGVGSSENMLEHHLEKARALVWVLADLERMHNDCISEISSVRYFCVWLVIITLKYCFYKSYISVSYQCPRETRVIYQPDVKSDQPSNKNNNGQHPAGRKPHWQMVFQHVPSPFASRLTTLDCMWVINSYWKSEQQPENDALWAENFIRHLNWLGTQQEAVRERFRLAHRLAQWQTINSKIASHCNFVLPWVILRRPWTRA